MKIKRKEFVAELKKVSAVAGVNGVLPILQCGLFVCEKGDMTIIATDMNNRIKVNIGVEDAGDMKFAAPLKNMIDILDKIKADEIMLKIDGNRMSIEAGKTKLILDLYEVSDYPEIKEEKMDKSISLKMADFKRSFGKVAHTVFTENSAHVLSGILIDCTKEGVKMVSTDGKRMTICKLADCDFESKIVINNISSLIARVFGDQEDIKIEFNDKYMCITSGSTVLHTTLISSNYPDYKKVIPNIDGWNNVKVDSGKFSESVGLISLMDVNSSGITMTIENGKFSVSKKDKELVRGDTEFEIEYKGKKSKEITVNSKFLNDFTKAYDDNEVDMSFSDEDMKPLFIKGKNMEYVIMPIRNIN